MATAEPVWRRVIGLLRSPVAPRRRIVIAAVLVPAVLVGGMAVAKVLNPDLAIMPTVMRRPPAPVAPVPPAATSRSPAPSSSPTPSPSRSRRPAPTPTPAASTGPEIPNLSTQSPSRSAPLLLSYEAEAAQYSSQPHRRAVAEASGGLVLGWIGQRDEWVRFGNVRVPAAGRYTLTVYYICGDGSRDATIVVNGSASIRRTYPGTDDWYDVRSLAMAIDLRSGTNTIEFQNVNPTYAPNLDRITVTSA